MQAQLKNTQKGIRVLHIMSGFGGGISSFIYNKALAMPKYQITFDVVTYDQCSPEFVAAIQATGGDVYQLINPKKKGWSAFKHSFTKVLKAYHYDLIHCHIDGYRVLPYRYLAYKWGIKRFYIHAHQSYTMSNSILNHVKLDINQWLNRSLTQAYLGCGKLAISGVYGHQVKQNQMMMIPNSIDVNQFIQSQEKLNERKQALRAQFGVKNEDFVIGQVTRFEKVKNHHFTLKLAYYMKKNKLPGRIFLAGTGNLLEEIKAEVSQRHLEDYVTFMGRLSPMQDYYPLFDVLLLPSIYEGLPTVVVEAQAIGLPVVMSDTITKEVDLNLNLVQQLNLKDPMADWYQAISQASQRKIPDLQSRKYQIEQENFSNESSAQLYVKFLKQDISHYII